MLKHALFLVVVKSSSARYESLPTISSSRAPTVYTYTYTRKYVSCVAAVAYLWHPGGPRVSDGLP